MKSEKDNSREFSASEISENSSMSGTSSERISRLELIVEQVGEATISTAQTVERLAERIDALAIQVQHQSHQVQQQGYQIFALCDALETLAETQSDSKSQLKELTEVLQQFVNTLKATDSNK